MSLIFRLTGSRVSSHCSPFLKRDSTKLINYVRSVSLNPTQAVTPPKEGHDERNMRLLRPQSPHLTIYKPQLTSMLSISHRFTGIILTSYAVALSMAAVYLECPIEFYIEKLRCAEIGAGPIYAIKFLLAFPLTYHFWNGIRHLLWDTAKFLTIKEVYLTGWTMLVIALISAAILSGMSGK